MSLELGLIGQGSVAGIKGMDFASAPYYGFNLIIYLFN